MKIRTKKQCFAHFILLLAALAFASPAWAQDCAPDDILLGSQSAVDNFQANHGPCDVVAGNLTISGNDIQDLDALTGIDVIEGDLTRGLLPRAAPGYPLDEAGCPFDDQNHNFCDCSRVAAE